MDADWPSQRTAVERWLAPDNFDAHGRQKVRLSDSSRPKARKTEMADD
jgi:hypothetical protein